MIQKLNDGYKSPIDTSEPIQETEIMEKRFTLKRRNWYAVDLIADDVPGSLEGGYGFSPIFILDFLPKKTGSRLFELKFFHVNYPEGVQIKAYPMQTVHRGKNYILAKTTDHSDVRFLCIHELTETWTRKHFKIDTRISIRDWLMEYAPREYFD